MELQAEAPAFLFTDGHDLLLEAIAFGHLCFQTQILVYEGTRQTFFRGKGLGETVRQGKGLPARGGACPG